MSEPQPLTNEQAFDMGREKERQRIIKIIDEAMHTYREHMGTYGALYALRCRVNGGTDE